MTRKLVAFLGLEGSGKSTNANKLVKDCGFTKLSFADALREMAFKIIGMDFNEGMSKYAELKQTEIYNGQNFRNILENLGSAVREQSPDFWVDSVLNKVSSIEGNICIDDMRYTNEYIKVYNYCVKNNIEFKAYFCNYKSDVYRTDNPHESARLARYLFDLNYKDLQEVNPDDILSYNSVLNSKKLKEKLKELVGDMKNELKRH